MTFNCLTLFPELFSGFAGASIAGRAITAGRVAINCIDFRDYTLDKHRRVDDYPFGGDPGMLLCAQPLFDCFRDVAERHEGERSVNIYMSPAGRPLTSQTAKRFGTDFDVLNILCGHYEGVDQRVLDTFIDEEISIGDYVLTGGELPAMVLMDCVMRFVPGVLSNDASAVNESFSEGLLEYPQYTRPSLYEGQAVPEILLSGHHARIEEWRRQRALEKTFRVRPDLLEHAELTDKDRHFLNILKEREDKEHEQGNQGD